MIKKQNYIFYLRINVISLTADNLFMAYVPKVIKNIDYVNDSIILFIKIK